MGRAVTILSASLVLYILLLIPFTAYMRGKTSVERLGYVPNADSLLLLSADQRYSMGAFLFLKVLMYFGGNYGDKPNQKIKIPIDYLAMARTIQTAVRLDPYNMDAYYFSQAILAWDTGQIAAANEILQYGMNYRTWDWYLPFFAGFNYAYFLKDYPHAATMYRKAADLSGEPLFANLAGRYLQQSGETQGAIAYLTMMEKGARDPKIKESFHIRLSSFMQVLTIEKAVAKFRAEAGRLPHDIKELVSRRDLDSIPRDPYGGEFYLRADGKVSTTSKFAFAGVKN